MHVIAVLVKIELSAEARQSQYRLHYFGVPGAEHRRPGAWHAACLWRRQDEQGFPIDGPSNQPYEQRLSQEADTLAALAAAGGGRG